MLLRKQLTYDLTNFKLNKLKYIFYIVETIYLFSLCIYPSIMVEWNAIVIIQVIQLIANITFLLTVNTIFEGKGCEYTINKLIYFPIKKSTFLLSKGILCVGLAFVQSFIAYIGTSVGRLFTDGEAVPMLYIYIFAFVASILSFSVMFGMRRIKVTIVVFAFEVPICILLLGDLMRDRIDLISIVVLICLFAINIIVNSISFRNVRV